MTQNIIDGISPLCFESLTRHLKVLTHTTVSAVIVKALKSCQVLLSGLDRLFHRQGHSHEPMRPHHIELSMIDEGSYC